MDITLTLLTSDFHGSTIVEDYSSLVWADRFNEFGDFELLVDPTPTNLIRYQQGYYLQLKSSEHLMEIENIGIKTDEEGGDKLRLSGRSFESILLRRIVWDQTILSGNLQTEVKRLLDENVIAPGVGARDITGLVFDLSVDSAITSLTIDGQYQGEYVYDVVSAICKSVNIGFKIIVDPILNIYHFSLYPGVDRSYDQLVNDFVIFSPTFDNLISSDYLSSTAIIKTVALVLGEGEGTDRLSTTVTDISGGGTGLSRREMMVNASDISQTTSGGPLPDPDYLYLLEQRGREVLADNQIVKHFEGQIAEDVLYSYGIDFFMGDLIQISNKYGNGGRSRVVEFVFSNDSSGPKFTPALSGLD